jgi:hypothetical protein
MDIRVFFVALLQHSLSVFPVLSSDCSVYFRSMTNNVTHICSGEGHMLYWLNPDLNMLKVFESEQRLTESNSPLGQAAALNSTRCF